MFITQGARLLWRRSKATNSEEGERGKKGSVTNQFSTGTSFSPASPCKNRKKKKRKKKHTEGFIGMTDPVASKTALFSSRFSMSLSRESRNFHAFRTQRSVKQTHAIFNTDWYTSKSRLHASSRSFARKPAGNWERKNLSVHEWLTHTCVISVELFPDLTQNTSEVFASYWHGILHCFAIFSVLKQKGTVWGELNIAKYFGSPADLAF